MADATKVKTIWLAKQLEPALGNFPIAEIEAYQVLDVLRKVERKGNLETAHRLFAALFKGTDLLITPPFQPDIADDDEIVSYCRSAVDLFVKAHKPVM